MIECKELNKSFENKEQMFAALKRAKADIVSLKKSQIQHSINKGLGVNQKMIDPLKFGLASKGLMTDNNFYYFVVNTTNILDSHQDLHKDGIWNKTIQDQQGKNYLVTDHRMEFSNVVAKKEYIQMLVAEIPFSAIGKGYAGNTQALIYKVPKDKIINQIAKEWIEAGDDFECSVRMQYVVIDLAMNSQAKDDEHEYRLYLDNINTIANISEFKDKIEYFWVVSEAKNIGESSLVLRGSNSSTGLLTSGKNEPIIVTHVEPSNDTQKDFFAGW